MAEKNKDQESRPDKLPLEETTSLRDALMSKVKDNEEGYTTHVTRHDIGSAPAEEDSALSRPISIGGPGYLERAIFCRQMATLIEVGIPVMRALQMLSKRTSNAKLRHAIEETARGVEEGQSIHQAMSVHQKVFSPLVVNIVRIGELGGILEDSMVRLAEIMEAKARIKRQVTSAMMYPATALFIAVAILVLILTVAIPQFAVVYEGANHDLPGPTQFVIDLSNFVTGAWPILLVVAVLGIVGLRMWSRTPGGRRTFSWIAIKTPILRGINQKIAVARSARTLSGLITAGIPLTDAMSITSDASENVLVGDAIARVHEQLEQGNRMAEPLAEAGVFPDLVVDMIGIGEETGTLDRMLTKVADIYDAEVDATLNGLSSIIEPLLIVVLGGMVIFIALAVLLPYFNLVDVIG